MECRICRWHILPFDVLHNKNNNETPLNIRTLYCRFPEHCLCKKAICFQTFFLRFAMAISKPTTMYSTVFTEHPIYLGYSSTQQTLRWMRARNSFITTVSLLGALGAYVSMLVCHIVSTRIANSLSFGTMFYGCRCFHYFLLLCRACFTGADIVLYSSRLW